MHQIVESEFMRLLIVEDDREAADYLKKALREAGHMAEVANDGEPGSRCALDESFDVIVVDRMLPKRDGLSVFPSCARAATRRRC